MMNPEDVKRYYTIVKKLQESGVDAQVVKGKLKPEEYTDLEYSVSDKQPERPSSEDLLDLMRLSVEVNDRGWFEDLCQRYNSLRVQEEIIKAELGFMG